MQTYETLISVSDLNSIYRQAHCLIVDCSRSPDEEYNGQGQYFAEHLPGALHAHLDRDLASPHLKGRTGRHPLPRIEAFAALLSRWGVDAGTQVVVYDHGDNMAASRLWWLIKWIGHDAVAVLDGGLSAWKKQGLPVEKGEGVPRPPTKFIARLRPEMVVTADEVAAALRTHASVIDARSEERFRGENEPYDPIAGHIPGASCLPYSGNLDSRGYFLSAAALADRFRSYSNEQQPVFYCGSGVSACHNILAWQVAGLGDAKLYVGSWSDWITDPDRPIAGNSQ